MGGFRNEISLMEPGTVINLKINRKGQIIMVPVTLGTANDKQLASGGIVGKLGMEVDNLTPEVATQLGYTSTEQGVVITKIKPGSPAAAAGLRPGFIVLAINHKKVINVGRVQRCDERERKNQARPLLDPPRKRRPFLSPEGRIN